MTVVAVRKCLYKTWCQHWITDASIDCLDVRLRILQERREAAGAVGDLNEDNDDEVEIIEVEEPFEPVPMQDSCLQVLYIFNRKLWNCE